MPPLELIPSRSFSQTLEELLNEEWPPEAEEEVRRIERLLLGPGAGPDPATPSTTSHPPSHPQYAVSSITSPPSSTQQMEDLLDLPWSDEEESIVRDIEGRALLLTASAFPSVRSVVATLPALDLLTSFLRISNRRNPPTWGVLPPSLRTTKVRLDVRVPVRPLPGRLPFHQVLAKSRSLQSLYGVRRPR